MCMSVVKRIWTVLQATWDGWRRNDGNSSAAALAYYAVFSLFPVCLVLIAGLGFWGRYSSLVQMQQRDLLDRLTEHAGPWLAGEIEKVLAGVQTQAGLGGPLGLLVLLVAAIGIFVQLEGAIGRIWGLPEPTDHGWLASLRDALWDRLLAFLTLLGIGVLLLTVLLTDAVFAGVRRYVVQLPAGQSAWRALQLLLTIGCDTLLFATIYRVLPQARVLWRHAVGGGLLAALLWTVARSLLFTLLVGRRYSVYGVVGAVMGVMLWFYCASAIVLLGAELVHALGDTTKNK